MSLLKGGLFRALCAVCVVGVMTLLPSVALATTYCRYKGPDGGDFWDAANWKYGVPKTAGNVAQFSSEDGTPCTVVITNAPGAVFDYIYVTSGEWTLKVIGTHDFGGDWDNSKVRVASGAKLTIVGGMITNTCFGADLGGQIVFDNCVTKSCVTHRRLGSGGTAEDREAYVFNGGKHNFRTMYMRLYQRALFGSGDFTFGSIYGFDRYGEGKQSKVPSYISLTGGRLSVTGDNKIDSPYSIGVTVSGNGWYRNTVSGSGHWLANLGSYGWRVEDHALIDTPGVYLATGYLSSTARVEVVGGRFVLKSALGGNGVNGAGRQSSVLIDGGILDCAFSAEGTLDATSVNETGSHYLWVGANGGRIRNRNNILLTINRSGFADAPGVVPGTLTFDGFGRIYLNQPGACTFSGNTKIRGYVQSNQADYPLGSGNIEIADGGILGVLNGKAVNGAVTFSGASYIWTDNSSCMEIPSLTRKGDGILILRSTASRTVYGTEANARYLSVETAPTLRSNGIPVDPIILMTREDDNGCDEVHFVNWDAANKRFVGAAYTTDITDGAGKVVCQNGELTVSQNLSVGALVLRSVVNGGSKTITVGDGEGPAMALLNPNSRNSSRSASASNWTLAFGSSRGIIAGGTKVSGVDNGCAKWNGYITGSGGVDFAFVDTGGIILYRRQNWTGGTRVMSGEILLMSSGSYVGGLPDGEVVIMGGEQSGGSVRFQVASTHTQHYTISGFGAAYSPANKKGALSIEKDVTLSGRITLSNDAMIGVTNGYTGTLTGGIDGIGDLYLGSPIRTGALALSGGVNLAGDLHIDTCVTNAGSIDLGGRFLYLNGTLVFNNSSDISVNAKVIGEGKIVLAGAGKVDFSDLSVFDGLVDVAGNVHAEIGALYGIVSVTNSAAGQAAITAAGTSAYGFFGSLAEGVDLAVSGGVLVGNDATIPAEASLGLAGGTVELYEPTTFASLYGTGTVLGGPIKVSGAVTPVAQGHEDAITFDGLPVLERGIPDGWSMRGTASGFALRRIRGIVMAIR